MAKHNQTKAMQKRNVSIVQEGYTAINKAGGFSYTDGARVALYKQVATSLWSGDGYYERHQDWMSRFRQNVADAAAEDLRYPFALAAYARDRKALALRTSPIGLYVEASNLSEEKGQGFIRSYAPKVLRRADEPAEAIAYQFSHFKHSIPNGMKRGIADTLKGFDEYQLAKYKGDRNAVTLRDVMRIARPSPSTEEQRLLFGRTVKGELEVPYTWEVEMSKATTDEEKRAKWNELINSGKMGLFALVRNISNIIKYGADIEGAFSQITKERVVGSGILPFQWYKAYKTISERYGVAIARPFEQAVEWSLEDLPHFDDQTIVVCDNSGSMSIASSRNMTNAEIGNLLGAMTFHISNNAYAGTFGSEFRLSANISKENSLFTNKAILDRLGLTTGHSTDAWKIFSTLTKEKIFADRVVILSDMQCYDSRFLGGSHTLSAELDSYMKAVNPNVRVYSINLATQDNTTQFSASQPVVSLGGFSESIFRFFEAIEQNRSIVDHIMDNY